MTNSPTNSPEVAAIRARAPLLVLERPEFFSTGLLVTVTVTVAGVPPEDGVIEFGLIRQVAPIGAPLHTSATESANPFIPVTFTVTFPDCPTPTERELLDSVALKSPMLSWAEADRVAMPFDSPTVKL
jgi:hypothetical protein